MLDGGGNVTGTGNGTFKTQALDPKRDRCTHWNTSHKTHKDGSAVRTAWAGPGGQGPGTTLTRQATWARVSLRSRMQPSFLCGGPKPSHLLFQLNLTGFHHDEKRPTG